MRPHGPPAAPSRRPGGLLRWLARAPALAYRLRLGRLLGHRFILIHHRGRKTGKHHQTVVEVVRYDRARRESFVVSAWGERADWYRNLQHGPAIAVETAGRRYRPEVRFLDRDERVTELARYARDHRLAARAIGRWLGISFDDSPGSIERASGALRMVAFRPRPKQ